MPIKKAVVQEAPKPAGVDQRLLALRKERSDRLKEADAACERAIRTATNEQLREIVEQRDKLRREIQEHYATRIGELMADVREEC